MNIQRYGLRALTGIGLGIGTAASFGADQPPSTQVAATRAASTEPALEIALDTSDAPEMAEWAAEAKRLCIKSYPMILRHLDETGFTRPTRVNIVFRNKQGVAYTSGSQITCCVPFFKAHPDDYGAVIHELCHVVQAYRKPAPGWVVEGIADYVRWFDYEPAGHRPRIRHPERAKYTDSYQTTAAFFDWIVRNKDKSFITRLNAACRRGQYKPELFREYTGQSVDELWAEFSASLPSSERPSRTVTQPSSRVS